MNKQEFKKNQSCVLRVPIHCDGCRQKVKKLLQKINGVYTVSIDAEQGKVTVGGEVDPAILIQKLEKKGKQAELWGGGQKGSNFSQAQHNNQFKNMSSDTGKGAKDNKSHQAKGGQQQQPQMKGGKDMKGVPNLKDQKSVKFSFPDEEFGSDFDDEFDDEDYDDEEEEFGHGGGHNQWPNNKMMTKGGGGGGSAKKGGGGGGVNNFPVQVKGMGGNSEKKNGKDGKKGGGGGDGGGKNKGGGKKESGKGGGLLGLLTRSLSMGRSGKSSFGEGKSIGKDKGGKKGGGKSGGSENIKGKSTKPGKGGMESKDVREGKTGKGGKGSDGGDQMGGNMGPMGHMGQVGPMGHMGQVDPMGRYPMPMGQIGNIPAVQGLPAQSMLNAPPMMSGGYYQGMEAGNPYTSQHQQYMPTMMNQQRANGTDMYQPMMYGRPPPPMNYIPSANDPYGNYFSDENPNGCSIM